jgi:hypothetical protein
MNEFDFGGRRASEFRQRGFWTVFRQRHPAEEERRVRNGPWFWQRWVPEAELVVSMYVAPQRGLIGVFYGRNERLGAVESRWKPWQLEIEAALGGIPDDERWSPGSLGHVLKINVFAEENWPDMADWVVREADRFEQAAIEVLSLAR